MSILLHNTGIDRQTDGRTERNNITISRCACIAYWRAIKMLLWLKCYNYICICAYERACVTMPIMRVFMCTKKPYCITENSRQFEFRLYKLLVCKSVATMQSRLVRRT